MSRLLALAIAIGSLGPAKEPGDADDAAARLAIMKGSLSGHSLRAADDTGPACRLKADPVMRFNKGPEKS